MTHAPAPAPAPARARARARSRSPRTLLVVLACVIAGGGGYLLTRSLLGGGADVAVPLNPARADGTWMVPIGLRGELATDPFLLVSASPLDMGSAPPGHRVTRELQLVNPGRRAVDVAAIRPLCSCISVGDAGGPRTIPPGAVVSLSLTMDAPDQPGRRSTKKVRLVAEGTGDEFIDVPLTILANTETSAVSGTSAETDAAAEPSPAPPRPPADEAGDGTDRNDAASSGGSRARRAG